MKTKDITALFLCLATAYVPPAFAKKGSASMTVAATVVDSCKIRFTQNAPTEKDSKPMSTDCNSSATYSTEIKAAGTQKENFNTRTNTIEVQPTKDTDKVIEIMY